MQLLQNCDTCKLLIIKDMVEAAGVEPASENAASKEPTYLVTFMRRG